jgi:hypothetical protein
MEAIRICFRYDKNELTSHSKYVTDTLRKKNLLQTTRIAWIHPFKCRDLSLT